MNVWLSLEETNTMDNLNCKIKAHARVCKENKLEEKMVLIKTILWLKVQV